MFVLALTAILGIRCDSLVNFRIKSLCILLFGFLGLCLVLALWIMSILRCIQFFYLFTVLLEKLIETQMACTVENRNRYNWELLKNSPTLSIIQFSENAQAYCHNLFMFIKGKLWEL